MRRERIAPEHGWRHTVSMLGVRIDSLTAFAFDCLESQGWRFCVHFGVLNAVEKAQDEWLKRLDGKKG